MPDLPELGILPPDTKCSLCTRAIPQDGPEGGWIMYYWPDQPKSPRYCHSACFLDEFYTGVLWVSPAAREAQGASALGQQIAAMFPKPQVPPGNTAAHWAAPAVAEALYQLTGEPNDAVTWGRLENLVAKWLPDAVRVQCDFETNPPDLIDKNGIGVNVFFKAGVVRYRYIPGQMLEIL